MNHRNRLKQEVLATIIEDLRKASKETGRDHWMIAREIYADVPHSVVTDACLELDDEEEAAWWEQMERTIDGQVIRNAIAAAQPAELPKIEDDIDVSDVPY